MAITARRYNEAGEEGGSVIAKTMGTTEECTVRGTLLSGTTNWNATFAVYLQKKFFNSL